MFAHDAVTQIWQLAGLPEEALAMLRLTGRDPVMPSSFPVGVAAQATAAAAALAACEFAHRRGAPRRPVHVDMAHAAIEAAGWFSVDGYAPALFDPLSGLYRARDGWVRLHAVFPHHRKGALHLLGLAPDTSERGPIEAAMARRDAAALEDDFADAGLVLTALRSFAAWDATAQGAAIAAQPLFSIERIGDAPPLPLPDRADGTHALLDGIRVLDLTRILAGPVAGRTLAAHGAEVMLVNAPHLPNIDAIAETSRGKLSALLDLRDPTDAGALRTLIGDAHVFMQGYRPGGLATLGFGPEAVAGMRPGIVVVSLSAYGDEGPWAGRRGFDSLVQTAMGFNRAEGEAAGQEMPRALPMQILDHATGFLIAACVAAALHRQACEGGSWHVRVSLAQTGHWLRGLGRIADGFHAAAPAKDPYLESEASGFGRLVSVGHSARIDGMSVTWPRPSMPPGSHPPIWPAHAARPAPAAMAMNDI